MARRMLGLLVFLTLLFTTASAGAENPIRVLVDGRKVVFDVTPQLTNGRILVPLRAVFDALGARVTWNNQAQDITATRGNRKLRLAAGSATAIVDGQPVRLDVPPVLFQGRILVPLRFVSVALGATVTWDGPGRKAVITSRELVAVDGQVPPEIVETVARNLPLLWPAVVRALGGVESIHWTPRVVIFADRERWFRHLLADQVDESIARQLADHAIGAALSGRPFEVHLLVNGSRYDYLQTLAHELGHVVIRRRGLEGKIPHWLNEGLVEYTALTLTKTRTLLDDRHWVRMRRRVLDLAATRKLEPLISEYAVWIDRIDDYPVLDQALLAVAQLVQHRGGLGSPARYLERLAATDHATAFREAFRVCPDDFALGFLDYLYDQARRPTGSIRVTLRIHENVKGDLMVFPPGVTQAECWIATGPVSTTIALDANGHLRVEGLASSRRTWQIHEPTDSLLVYFTPAQPLKLDHRLVNAKGIVFENAYGHWYWCHNAVFWGDGEQGLSTDNPAYPLGIEIVEVISEPSF